MGNVFVSSHPLVKCRVTQLRDATTLSREFLEVSGELARLLAFEACADLELEKFLVSGVLEDTTGYGFKRRIAIVPILRAGLGMVGSIQAMLPKVKIFHMGFYRDEETLRPVSYYKKLDEVPTVDVCLVLDPMLATGGSAIAAVNALKKWGANRIKRIKFIGFIAAPAGVEKLSAAHPDVHIHLAALDDRLNEKGYILPGLGDAGDRMFGTE